MKHGMIHGFRHASREFQGQIPHESLLHTLDFS